MEDFELDREDLKFVIKHVYNTDLNKSQLEVVFDYLDADRTGYISYAEVVIGLANVEDDLVLAKLLSMKKMQEHQSLKSLTATV